MADTWISHTFNLNKTFHPNENGAFSLNLQFDGNDPLDPLYEAEWYAEADKENLEPMITQWCPLSHKWELCWSSPTKPYITLRITGEVLW